ncbi:MAG: hypothetical protein HS115_18165 [Spirochaetales bacterium]|nr:hypothetical protein [Spirochaetales bacterium]
MIFYQALRSTIALRTHKETPSLLRLLELERASLELELYGGTRSQGLILLLPDAGPSFREKTVSLARALSVGGYTVALPEILDLREEKLTPATGQLLFEIIINLSLNFQLCPQGRIGVVASGRSALLALLAAGNPEIADLIANLCLIHPVLTGEEERSSRKKSREELPETVEGQLDLLRARLSGCYRKDLPRESQAVAQIQAAARQDVPFFALEKSDMFRPSGLMGHYQVLRTFQAFFRTFSRKKAEARPVLELEDE